MDRPRARPGTQCDVFCRVVDNFGDAAVAWRIARSLAIEHGFCVRLLIDQPAVLERLLQRRLDRSGAQDEAVEVLCFDDSKASAAPLLIETFGCGLPAGFLERRPENAVVPVLINVEYLSAESWIDGVHRLSSPATADLPERHFFFPGFTSESGGLLREASLRPRQHALSERTARDAWLNRFGIGVVKPGSRRVSFFVYDNNWPERWLDQLAHTGQRLQLIVAEGVMSEPVRAYCGTAEVGSRAEKNGLEVIVVPFLAQDDFDELLLCCDGNVVRGEDSFVRAQLAGVPMLWDSYPQHDLAHARKLDAFLLRYLSGWQIGERGVVEQVARGLIARQGDFAQLLADWVGALERLSAPAWAWREGLESLPELGSELAILARKLLK